MTEIYKGSSNYAYLDLQGVTADSPPTAVVVGTPGGPLTVTSAPAPVVGTERWSALLSIVHSQTVREFVVRWEFTVEGNEVAQEDHYEVVVPLVSPNRIREELSLDPDITDDDLVLAERRVRRIIEDVCGQSFSLSHGTLYVSAGTDAQLRLPSRLYTLESATAAGFPLTSDQVRLTNDGWVLHKANPYIEGFIYSPKHVIDDPYHAARSFWRNGALVAITGYWGWEKVPSAVEEAALILIEDRLCPEAVYRDRYLQSMTAADWRIQFHAEAYRGTGNAIADQILRNYVVRSMAVI